MAFILPFTSQLTVLINYPCVLDKTIRTLNPWYNQTNKAKMNNNFFLFYYSLLDQCYALCILSLAYYLSNIYFSKIWGRWAPHSESIIVDQRCLCRGAWQAGPYSCPGSLSTVPKCLQNEATSRHFSLSSGPKKTQTYTTVQVWFGGLVKWKGIKILDLNSWKGLERCKTFFRKSKTFPRTKFASPI